MELDLSHQDPLEDHEIHLETRVGLPESPVVYKSDKLPQIMAAVTANLGVVGVGSLLTWSSPAIQMLREDDAPFNITEHEASWVGSLLSLGCVFGAPAFGFLINRLGRRLGLLTCSIPLVFSWILILSTQSVAWVYVARFISGFPLAAMSFVIPIYVTEITEPSIRGALGAIAQIGFNLGILYSYAVGAIGNYMMLNLSCLILPIVFVLIFFWMPDTPQFLLSKNDYAGAAKSLQWLRGKAYNIDSELLQLKEASLQDAKNKGSLQSALRSRVAVKALIISVGLVVAQQLSGISVVLFFTESIFKSAGSKMSARISSVIVGFVMLITSFITMPIVDRAGRRILLLISSAMEMLSLFVLGLFFLLKEQLDKDVSFISWLPLACLIVYISVYCLGLGPLPWVVMAEVLPPNVKGIGGAIVTSSCWFTAFALTSTFQSFIDLVGSYFAFWLFSLFSGLAFLFVLFMVPETKGITLQEIQLRLAGSRMEDVNGVV